MKANNKMSPELISAMIANKSRTDHSVAENLKKNPEECVQSVSGVSVPDSVDVHVVQNTTGTVHVALPDYAVQKEQADKHGGEMSEEEMTQVCGGEAIGGWVWNLPDETPWWKRRR